MGEINQKIYDKAVKLLSLRLHTTGELHRKLRQKGFADSGILPVLKRLEELSFLDDLRFAEIFVDNLKRYKDWGYYGIKSKLHARQVPSDLAGRALNEFFTAEDELGVARKILTKRKIQGINREKLLRLFSAKGFRSETIRRVLGSTD